uniref:Uncharacterized protein n=1 Tax=Sus scrofa TaxID=9823 RepID=A0A8D1SA92_PIG
LKSQSAALKSRKRERKKEKKKSTSLHQLYILWVETENDCGVGRPLPGEEELNLQRWIKDGTHACELRGGGDAPGQAPVTKGQNGVLASKKLAQEGRFLRAKKPLGLTTITIFQCTLTPWEAKSFRCLQRTLFTSGVLALARDWGAVPGDPNGLPHPSDYSPRTLMDKTLCPGGQEVRGQMDMERGGAQEGATSMPEPRQEL